MTRRATTTFVRLKSLGTCAVVPIGNDQTGHRVMIWLIFHTTIDCLRIKKLLKWNHH